MGFWSLLLLNSLSTDSRIQKKKTICNLTKLYPQTYGGSQGDSEISENLISENPESKGVQSATAKSCHHPIQVPPSQSQ